MQDDIGVFRFLERTLKRIYQLMRQFVDESDGIGKQYLRSARERALARREIERCKKLILR